MIIRNCLLLGQCGVPKYKRSPYRKMLHTMGIHFKHKHLRFLPWYHCPICGEPKRTGTYCRAEACRNIKA